ncbi:MAG TPA: SDR family NAD(P)-dependent oxidoreductase [Holophagaceae bacterium]|nr:SDR family NAD(P)-dependent oxidoreductase [Holophagaceae bacterium]
MPRPIALVTGASSGFGEAIARTLAQEGFDLALCARRGERLEALAAQLRASGTQVHTGSCDVRERSQIVGFADSAARALGGLNLIVCNAGLARGLDRIEGIPEVDLDQMLDTNVKGLVFTIQAGLPHVRKSGGGHVVLIGSTAGHATYEGGGVYCASKHGVKALAQTLRLELCGEPIRVTSIDPGMAETEFSLVRLQDQAKADGVYKGMTPLRAEDIAECVRWVATLPAHVNIDEIIVKPTDQGSHTGAKVHRRG